MSPNNQIVSPRRSKRIKMKEGLKQSLNKEEEKKPILKIGVITDIQHAPIPMGYSYSGVPRYYEHALETAEKAAIFFQRNEMDFVLNLGDTIDGKCLQTPQGGRGAISNVIKSLNRYNRGEIYHTYGNHELYTLHRREIKEFLNIPFQYNDEGEFIGYYTKLIPETNVRLIFLDSYDICLLQRAKNSTLFQQATEILKHNNPNYPHAENSPDGLEGNQRRFVAFNGAASQDQLNWFEKTLEKAQDNHERCFILSHQPILPSSTSPICLMWNYEQVLEIIRTYSSTIMACFSGHAHKGGYKRDKRSGVHFRVLEAVLETNAPKDTFCVLNVYKDFLEIQGFGDCKSAEYKLDHLHAYEESTIR